MFVPRLQSLNFNLNSNFRRTVARITLKLALLQYKNTISLKYCNFSKSNSYVTNGYNCLAYYNFITRIIKERFKPGGSMKSKCTKSSIPSFFNCNTTEPKLERKISG